MFVSKQWAPAAAKYLKVLCTTFSIGWMCQTRGNTASAAGPNTATVCKCSVWSGARRAPQPPAKALGGHFARRQTDAAMSTNAATRPVMRTDPRI